MEEVGRALVVPMEVTAPVLNRNNIHTFQISTQIKRKWFAIFDLTEYILGNIFFVYINNPTSTILPSQQIRRIPKLLYTHKVLLDAPRTHKPVEDTHAPRFIVCPTGTCPSKGLLPDHGACAFLIVVHVSGGVAQAVSRCDEGFTISGETK